MEVEFARAEGAHEAVPESLLESHELIRTLQRQVSELIAQVKAPSPKWLERVWGFGFGVVASLSRNRRFATACGGTTFRAIASWKRHESRCIRKIHLHSPLLRLLRRYAHSGTAAKRRRSEATPNTQKLVVPILLSLCWSCSRSECCGHNSCRRLNRSICAHVLCGLVESRCGWPICCRLGNTIQSSKVWLWPELCLVRRSCNLPWLAWHIA